MNVPRPSPRTWVYVLTRLVFGGLCSWGGWCSLQELPAAALAAGLPHTDWPRWWAAAIAWDAGAVVTTGWQTRPAALLAGAALGYSALTNTEPLPTTSPIAPDHTLAALTALALLLIAVCPRPRGCRPTRPVLPRRSFIAGVSAVPRTELLP